MVDKNNELTLLNTRCWADVLESLKYTFKNWVKEVVEEVIDDKMCNANLDDKRLNAEELCKRDGVSQETLFTIGNEMVLFRRCLLGEDEKSTL